MFNKIEVTLHKDAVQEVRKPPCTCECHKSLYPKKEDKTINPNMLPSKDYLSCSINSDVNINTVPYDSGTLTHTGNGDFIVTDTSSITITLGGVDFRPVEIGLTEEVQSLTLAHTGHQNFKVIPTEPNQWRIG